MHKSAVVTAVLAAMWVLVPSASARPRAHASGACSFSFVNVTVYNETAFRMDPYFFDKGFTNSVCESPGSVQPGTSGHWKVGDVLFGTSAEVRYRFENGDEVQLTTFVYPGERNPSLACGWTRVVTSPRAFDCKANWLSGAVTGKADVQLRVLPVPASVGVGAPKARSAVTRGCLHGSALIGTTTNKTGVSLKLLSVSHGQADAWCRAPRPSQTARSTARWRLGGPRSGASARFTYRLPNGDTIDFAAAVNPRGGTIGCAPLDRASARLFACRAIRNRAANSESPSIDLEIFRTGGP